MVKREYTELIQEQKFNSRKDLECLRTAGHSVLEDTPSATRQTARKKMDCIH